MVASVAKRFISPMVINIRVIPEISSSALTGTLFGPFCGIKMHHVLHKSIVDYLNLVSTIWK